MLDLIRHLGPELIHITAASNLTLIKKHGLMPAAMLARRAGLPEDEVALRSDRRVLQTDFGACTLNHQKPILHGTVVAGRSLEGMSRQEWVRQLDQRVFFWPTRLGERFRASIAADIPVAVIRIDTGQFLAHYADQIDLSPINSGSFRQGGANTLRGTWLYVPAKAGLKAFRKNRVQRGLVKSSDSVREVSLRGMISANDLAHLCYERTLT